MTGISGGKMKRTSIMFIGMILAGNAYADISIEGFNDGIHHYQNKNGKDYPRYKESETVKIADNLLLYQKNVGGWVENQDPLRILSDEEVNKIAAGKSDLRISFDNRNTYTQVIYLAYAYQETGDKRYADAALKGLRYTLNQQYKICGGWPHTIPPKPATKNENTNYHRYITNADDITSGILTMLRRVINEPKTFDFVDEHTKTVAEKAIQSGDECLLRTQLVQNGVKTGWAGQYDPESLEPKGGRSYELTSILTQETIGVLEYLMSIPNPSPEIINSVNSAVTWLKKSAIPGIRIEKFQAEKEQYQWHSSDWDRRLVKDPAAPPMWARFYDINDNSVILANRDGNRVDSYDKIARERRTGYSWYGTWPTKLLDTTYPEWLKKNSK